MLLEENKPLKVQRSSIEKMCKNKEQLRAATGINPECFICLFNNLNRGEDCSNIKFDASKRLSKEKYTNSEEVKSGPKPKISKKEQLFMD